MHLSSTPSASNWTGPVGEHVEGLLHVQQELESYLLVMAGLLQHGGLIQGVSYAAKDAALVHDPLKMGQDCTLHDQGS